MRAAVLAPSQNPLISLNFPVFRQSRGFHAGMAWCSRKGRFAFIGGNVLIFPAIDLRGGRCVRLRQGDYDQETVFGSDPEAMARRWVEEGAEALHLVDLDGAK